MRNARDLSLAVLAVALCVAAASPASSQFIQKRYGNAGIADGVACTENSQDGWRKTVQERTEWLQKAPDDIIALFERSTAYGCLGDQQAAIIDLNRAAVLAPKNPQIYYDLGATYADMHDYPDALTNYTHAIALEPDLAKAYNNRGTTYETMGNYDAALADFGAAISLEPTYADAIVNRAQTYAFRGRSDLALADLNKAISLEPQDVNAYVNLGALQYRLGHWTDAIAAASMAIKVDPNEPIAYLNRCEARTISNIDLAAALEDCTKDLSLRPGHTNTLEIRSILQFRLANYDGAIADADACLAQDSRRSAAMLMRGFAKLRKGDAADGDADIAAAAAIQPDVEAEYARYGITR
ncbi:MAG TPA: tetratricopeptide repeat protein [Rhizomicrobium sp.]|jgi:tetratricopeptide (TPR) repeat protein